MNSSQVTQRSALVLALALAVGGGYAAAQGKPAQPASAGQRGTGSPVAMKSEKSKMKSCPMHDAAALADVAAENTADGAVIRLKAKKPGDVQRIQELAAKMAEHLSGGCTEHCDMMHGDATQGGMMHGGMMHGGGMHGGHDHPGPKGGAREPASPPAAPAGSPRNR